jgi:hypothetical protein
MSSNIIYDTLKEKLLGVLFGVDGEDDFRVDTMLKMAVRDIINELGDSVGTITTRSINITVEEDADDGEDISRIYLPDDCVLVKQVLIEGIEVEPVTSAVFEKLKRSVSSGMGYFSKVARRIDGKLYLEIFPTLIVTDYDIAITYKLQSDDVGRIPLQYENAVIYGTAAHWYNIIHIENPVMSSKMTKRYKEYIGSLRADVSNVDPEQLRPYQTEWEKQFRFFTDRNDRDRR